MKTGCRPSCRNWLHKRLGSLGPSAMLVVCSLIGHVSAQQKITFRFDPPDNTSFVETLTHTKSLVCEKLGEPAVQETKSQTKYVIRKKPFGYSVVVTPVKPSVQLSDDVSKVAMSLLREIELTYDLDARGKLLRVRGTDVAADGLRRVLPPELLDLITNALSQGHGMSLEDLLKQQATCQWGQRDIFATGFVGTTVVLNNIYSGAGSLPAPFGDQQYPVSQTMQVAGPVPHDGRECVRISTTCLYGHIDLGPTTREAARVFVHGLLAAAGVSGKEEFVQAIEKWELTVPRVFDTAERVSDPATGLIYSQESTRAMQLFFKMDKVELKALVKEQQRVQYAYAR